MALFKSLRGKRTNLPSTKTDGYAYFCTDDGTFHIDYKDDSGVVQRKQVNAANSDTVNNHTVESDVPSNAKFTDTTYSIVTTSANGLMSYGDKTKLNGIAEGANKTIVDSALSSTSTNPVQNKIINTKFDSIQADIDSKVDKVDGKGLSTNDYTTEEKNKLAGLDSANYVAKSGDTMTGKLTAPQIETGSDDANYFQSRKFRGEGDASTYYHAIDFGYANHDQVDFYEYGGLWNFYKNTSATKGGTLCGKISSNGWEGSAKLTGAPTAPTATSGTNTTQIATTAFVQTAIGDKVDKVTGKGLSTNDYTTAEKDKLAAIEDGANKTIVDTALSSTSTNPVQNKVINTKFNSVQSDIDSKVPSTRTVNGKALSANITLSASDVGALPSTTQIPSIDGLATETYVDNKVAGLVDSAPATLDTLNELAAALGDDPNFATTVATQIGTKVDKVDGKGLSTNDYTTTEKSKLSGIAEGAEVNQNAFSNVVVGSTTVAADSKTDTLTLVAGTNVTLTPDAANDKITIESKDTVYTHPSYTAKSSGLYKITVDSTGHVSATAAVAKSDITGLGIPAQDTTYSDATTSASGLMSSSDKTKLNGIETGAEVNQNAFSNIVVGSTTIAADSTTDALTLVAGDNVTLTPDATNDKITIASKDTIYTHPSYTARTGVPTANQTPAFGGTFNVSQPVSDATGHITAINSRTITIPSTEATTSTAGLMSASDKSKLDGLQDALDSKVDVSNSNWVQIYDSGAITSEVNSISGIDITGYKSLMVAVKCVNTTSTVSTRAGAVIFTGNGQDYAFNNIFNNLLKNGTTTSGGFAKFKIIDGFIICETAMRAINADGILSDTEGEGFDTLAPVSGGLIKCTNSLSIMAVSTAAQSADHYYGVGSRVIVWGCKI